MDVINYRRVKNHIKWLQNRNKKNLKLRTEKRRAQKLKNAKRNKYREKYIKISELKSHNFSSKTIKLEAPICFSFIQNTKETTDFFDKMIKDIEKNNFKNFFIDISKIEILTTDALMYLLAILKNIKGNFHGTFAGNTPNNEKVKRQFIESGFYRHVQHRKDIKLYSTSDNIKISNGHLCDTNIAKQISDFVAKKASVSITKCQFLYIMIIELMSNTHKHAYNNNNSLFPQWYCYVEYIYNDIIRFTFMDTGAGIPSTVRKNFMERIDLLKIRGEDRYVISALNGEFRTSTGHAYRGKGLPKIREFCTYEKIHNLRIITNGADVSVMPDGYSSKIINTPLQGTLYHWEINLSDFKEK